MCFCINLRTILGFMSDFFISHQLMQLRQVLSDFLPFLFSYLIYSTLDSYQKKLTHIFTRNWDISILFKSLFLINPDFFNYLHVSGAQILPASVQRLPQQPLLRQEPIRRRARQRDQPLLRPLHLRPQRPEETDSRRVDLHSNWHLHIQVSFFLKHCWNSKIS